ncbi:hypothetical protein FAD43_18300 [Escherichia coli]|nr:hypothetical protein [Escherichia coli]EFB9645599.1 hypothetical protein [Escherichia coli]EFC2190457.1 hypothetical protein [Escherichia coli]MMU45201.1 hypothetical protein [Escherichia coli]
MLGLTERPVCLPFRSPCVLSHAAPERRTAGTQTGKSQAGTSDRRVSVICLLIHHHHAAPEL